MLDEYLELVELLDEVGVLQLEDDWAQQIRELITQHRLNNPDL